ncbi:MAG: S9 family peptidase, partial [Cyanobacteria bacterium J06607_6]
MLKPKFSLLAIAIAVLTLVLPPPQAAMSADPAILSPGDNLVIQNIPPIPLSLVEQADRYTQSRTAALQSWHPTRREMLISTRFGESSQAHRVGQPLGQRYQLTFFDERVSRISYQPTDGDYFVFSKDSGGNEANQIYRYDLETGDIILLTDGTSRNSSGVWSTAGDRLVYTSSRRNGADSDLYIVDPLQPEGDRLLAEVEGGGWFPTDWSPDDQQIVVIQYISINETYLWLFDAQTGERTRLTEPTGDEPVAYLEALFGPDGQGLYVVSDRGSEFLQLGYFELPTQTLTALTDDIAWNVEAVALAPNGQQLAFIINENGASKLYLMETATGQKQPLSALPAGMMRGLEWRKNGEELGFTLMSARSTADIFSLNVATGEVQRWTQSETAGLNPETFSEPELVEWQSFDGRTITGFLYRPPAQFTGPRPVAMYIHGGPEGQFRPAYLGRLNYYLNELGIALLFPNVRGSTG